MSEAKAELPGPGAAQGRPRSGAASAVAAERRRIGGQLHQTILQELTVAGLRLKALQATASDPVAAAIGDFAGWLRERQAELRDVVAELEQGRSGDAASVLAAIAAHLRDGYGCAVTFDPLLRPDLFGSEIWSAVIDTAQGVAEIAAGDLAARHVDFRPAGAARPALEVSHDGVELAGRNGPLAALRALAGGNGASLRFGRAGDRELLILDWAG